VDDKLLRFESADFTEERRISVSASAQSASSAEKKAVRKDQKDFALFQLKRVL
jgi:hypothetical protein